MTPLKNHKGHEVHKGFFDGLIDKNYRFCDESRKIFRFTWCPLCPSWLESLSVGCEKAQRDFFVRFTCDRRIELLQAK